MFINVTAFQNGTSASPNWDLNPFFGGLGIANAPGFQPVRIGTGNEDSIFALGLGSSIGGTSTFSTGWGGSGAEDDSGHLGPGASQFSSGQIGYMGFKLIRDDSVNYGWMRLILTQNGDAGSILDWAYDSSGNSILTGAVADLGANPLILNTGSEQTFSASEVGSGLLMEGDAKITFNEGTAGGTYTGNIQGQGEIRVDGAGGLRLSGANPFSGTTLILEGSRLTVGEAENLAKAQIRINNSASLVFDSLAANDGSANTFANDIHLDGETATLNNSGSGKVSLSGTLDSSGGLLGFAGGSFDVLGSISGSGGLRMEGTGTLTLAGNNTYTGDTFVSAGTLLVTGELSATAVTVEGLAAFGGIGTLEGDLDFADTAMLHVVDISDAMRIIGNVTFGSGFGIANLSGIDWDKIAMDSAFTILSTTQKFSTSDISNLGVENAIVVGSTGRMAYFQTGSLQLVVIPEPSALLLGGFSLLALLLLRRRGHAAGD